MLKQTCAFHGLLATSGLWKVPFWPVALTASTVGDRAETGQQDDVSGEGGIVLGCGGAVGGV